MKKGKNTTLSMVGFFALTVVMVMDTHEYPVFATSGFQLLFFLLLGGVLWFIPTALCSAEMATVDGWEEGGIFTWVKNTLGERWGFAAIFFQWFQITVAFITMLYFIIGVATAAFGVNLDSQPLLKFICIMVIFWALTFSQFGGTKWTAGFGKSGLFVGILIPAGILAVLSIIYAGTGGQIQIDTSPAALIPDFSKPATLVVFVSFILSYGGIEASASYVNELDNPRKNYPRAIFLVVIIAIVINAIGGLSVAITVPQSQLSLSSGTTQALTVLFTHLNANAGWLANVVSFLMAVGVVGEISGWIVGPARGMYAAAQRGLLSPVFRKVNKKGVPLPLILVQGAVVTIWGAVLTFGGGGNNLSFYVTISLTVVIYLFAYLLLFLGYFKLTLHHADLKRGYHVPGGKGGKLFIAGMGFVVSLFALGISFISPSSIPSNEATAYTVMLSVCAAIVACLPFILYARHDKSKHKTLKKARHFRASEVNQFIDPIARGEHHIDPEKEDYI